MSENKTKIISVRFTEKEYDAFVVYCKAQRLPMSLFIRNMIKDVIDN